MDWHNLSFHFKQTYEGGYRYLDKCGEFMLDAIEKWNLIAGDAKPSGAKLELPEQGVNVVCDSVYLAITQELPPADSTFFVNLCKGLAAIAGEHFRPKGIAKNGFCIKSFHAFSKVEEMYAASLGLGGDYQKEFGKILGLSPEYKRLDYNFGSGSKELRLLLHPATFERLNLTKQNAGFQANKIEKSAIDRRNVFVERVAKMPAHALLLELDLMESDPPEATDLARHFDELRQRNESLQKLFGSK